MKKCLTCQSNGADHDQIVRRCLSSPWWTGKYLLGFNWFSDSPYHYYISEWFVRKLKEGKRRFIIMTPRDHLKTSLFGISTIVWNNLRDPMMRTLYMMASCEQAEKTLRVVSQSHKSDAMKHFFPGRVLDTSDPYQKSTKTQLILPRENHFREGTVEAYGVNSTLTGGHFRFQIFDDLIDKTIKDSVTEQEKVISFFKDATNMFVDPKEDVRIVIGTLWEGEFYQWLLEESGLAEYYEKLVIGCYVDDRYRDFMADLGKIVLQDDGEPIWPQHFTKEILDEIRIEEGPAMFSRQYLNIESSEADKHFLADDFQYYTISPDNETIYVDRGEGQNTLKIPVSRLYRVMTIDPATGENKKTDETAIEISGLDKQTGLIFLLEDFAARLLPLPLIDKTLELAVKWRPHVIAPEDVSYQKTFKHYLLQEMNQRKIHFSIRPVTTGNEKKGTRIQALQPFIKNGQFYVRKEHYKLVRELTKVQISRGSVLGKSPNRADALAYHVQFWRGISIPDTDVKDEIEFEDQMLYPERYVAYGMACST